MTMATATRMEDWGQGQGWKTGDRDNKDGGKNEDRAYDENVDDMGRDNKDRDHNGDHNKDCADDENGMDYDGTTMRAGTTRMLKTGTTMRMGW